MTTIHDLAAWKAAGRRFAMLTAYDYTSARLLDAAGIPVLLVGDSAGMLMLGHPTTVPVTLDEMLVFCRAVARAATSALLVGDLPFGSYQASPDSAVEAAVRMLKEGGMHAVKLEGGQPVTPLVRRLVAAGIPVMAHVGLTPQSVHALGGFRVQGRDATSARRILADCYDLEAAGAFSVVLEAVPADLAATITGRLRIPTIGIGAGAGCDGQVLVYHDMLGLTTGRRPRFVKDYGGLGDAVIAAATRYRQEVEEGVFPGPEHTYGATPAVEGAPYGAS